MLPKSKSLGLLFPASQPRLRKVVTQVVEKKKVESSGREWVAPPASSWNETRSPSSSSASPAKSRWALLKKAASNDFETGHSGGGSDTGLGGGLGLKLHASGAKTFA